MCYLYSFVCLYSFLKGCRGLVNPWVINSKQFHCHGRERILGIKRPGCLSEVVSLCMYWRTVLRKFSGKECSDHDRHDIHQSQASNITRIQAASSLSTRSKGSSGSRVGAEHLQDGVTIIRPSLEVPRS